MLSLAEEFPVRDTYQQTANVPVIANNKLDNGIKFVSRSRDSGVSFFRFFPPQIDLIDRNAASECPFCRSRR